MHRVVITVGVAGLLSASAMSDYGPPWLCNGISLQVEPENNEYWDELASYPAGGLDRVIWDGGFTESTSSSAGPGGRWFGRHGGPESLLPIEYRGVFNDDEGGCLELVQLNVDCEAWVHGFTFGQVLSAGPLGLPMTPTDAVTLTFRARMVSANDKCDPFAVQLFVHDRSVPGSAPVKLWSESMFIEDTQGQWATCRLSVPLGSGLLDDYDVARLAPRVVFSMLGEGSNDLLGVLQVDDIQVDLGNCSREAVGLRLDGDACVAPYFAHAWWSFMCSGDYQGGGSDGTQPLAMPEPCPLDLSGDCTVDVVDLLEVIGGWGECASDGPCAGDVDGDQLVDVNDLLAVIAGWGGDCP